MSNPPPRHIAVIMDGNRRWARQRLMPTVTGHAAGARRVREIVRACSDAGIPYLSLFAFSTENWKRPEQEVAGLMSLFTTYLEREVRSMNEYGVRLRIAGDRSKFSRSLQDLITRAEETTANNTAITLTVCANYGGRWDMVQAAQAWQAAHPGRSLDEMDEAGLTEFLSTAPAPEVDLLIRTGGESRVSNFMLWQAAYAEIFCTQDLWPEFTSEKLHEAMAWFQQRDRRFGSSAPI